MGLSRADKKIMFVDTSVDGHHLVYLNSLLQVASAESFAVLPENCAKLRCRQKLISFSGIRSFSSYRRWIKELQKIAELECPDIVHFLDGDSIMRHFGYGLGAFKNSRIVITFHHFFEGKLREVSMKRMLRQDNYGVVHTDEIKHKVKRLRIKHVTCIPYPCFLDSAMRAGDGFHHEIPVLLALGGTRHDKGLDILLNALKQVTVPFFLIIAGKEEDFKEKYIRNEIKPYEDKVKLVLRFLSDGEVLAFLKACDIIVLPYRKEFDGASGPMCQGIYLGKTIVGPSHGSLGLQIEKFHVGYTFESENVHALAECLETALRKPCIYDKTAQKAQEELREEKFQTRYRRLYERISV